MVSLRDHKEALCVATVGLALVDHVYELEVFPSKSEKYFASSCRDIVGGIAANAAVAICHLGARAKLVGRVGDDNAGQFITSELATSNVELDCLTIVQGISSPTSAVLVDKSGERIIVNYRSPELFSDPPQIETERLLGVSAILADLRWLSGTLKTFEWANRQSIPTVLDFDLCPDEVPAQILKTTTHVIFGESALRKHTSIDDLVQALKLVKNCNPKAHVAVTAGSDGVWFLNDRDEAEHIQSRQVNVVNTLGAGDVFHGAAALAIGEGKSFQDALRFANDVAAVRVSHNQPNHFPSREDIKIFERTIQ